eukprot:Nitzschia sp. Nitz4//scaffold198_size39746//19206//20402//NITZ4_007602-RA/size39746-processed-gene-0.58-mRNA-1//1//CDS//3329540521//6968//frame0
MPLVQKTSLAVQVPPPDITPKLFHCGGVPLNRNLSPTLRILLPDYEWIDLRSLPPDENWWSRPEANITPPILDTTLPSWALRFTQPWDVFVTNYQFQPRTGGFCQTTSLSPWLEGSFAGKVIFWTPEDAILLRPLVPHPHYVFWGPGSTLPLTFLQTALWSQVGPNSHAALQIWPRQQQQRLAAAPVSNNNASHFLIYAHSHCVGVRQSAFRQIAQRKDFPPVHFGGRCDGNSKQLRNESRVLSYSNKVSLSNWEDNRFTFQNFRFCLTMEHVNTPGYMTEKILVAFWAGCVPIYWGPTEIFEVFHRDSFVYWDPANPSLALERIRYLEKNRTAYQQVVEHSIWAPGALDKYFSFHNGIEGASYRRRLRRTLGIVEEVDSKYDREVLRELGKKQDGIS